MFNSPTFADELEQLLDNLIHQPHVPSDAINSALELVYYLPKLLAIVAKSGAALTTGESFCPITPSDLFKSYMAAFRAGDWPLVGVVQQEIRSKGNQVRLDLAQNVIPKEPQHGKRAD